ncbi:MAG: hypothetical protein ACMXYK_00555 [Candidatus Woesearchaeota archaeon]
MTKQKKSDKNMLKQYLCMIVMVVVSIIISTSAFATNIPCTWDGIYNHYDNSTRTLTIPSGHVLTCEDTFLILINGSDFVSTIVNNGNIHLDNATLEFPSTPSLLENNNVLNMSNARVFLRQIPIQTNYTLTSTGTFIAYNTLLENIKLLNISNSPIINGLNISYNGAAVLFNNVEDGLLRNIYSNASFQGSLQNSVVAGISAYSINLSSSENNVIEFSTFSNVSITDATNITLRSVLADTFQVSDIQATVIDTNSSAFSKSTFYNITQKWSLSYTVLERFSSEPLRLVKTEVTDRFNTTQERYTNNEGQVYFEVPEFINVNEDYAFFNNYTINFSKEYALFQEKNIIKNITEPISRTVLLETEKGIVPYTQCLISDRYFCIVEGTNPRNTSYMLPGDSEVFSFRVNATSNRPDLSIADNTFRFFIIANGPLVEQQLSSVFHVTIVE